MDNNEKVAYYCSELSRPNESQQQRQKDQIDSSQIQTTSNNINNNIRFNVNNSNNNKSNSNHLSNVLIEKSTAINHINCNNNNNEFVDSKFSTNNSTDCQESSPNQRDFYHQNQNRQHRDNLNIQATPTSQQPFLVCDSNMMNPAKISRQQQKVQTFVATGQQFQNHQPTTANFQSVSHNQQQQQSTFQPNAQHHQVINQTRPLLHFKTSSTNSDNQNIHTNIKNDKESRDIDADHQSASQSDADPRLRNKSENLGLTSEVGLEKLDLGLEATLINLQSMGNNPNLIDQNDHNSEAMFVNQQLEQNPDLQQYDYNSAYKQSQTSQPSKNSCYAINNKLQENIYEDIETFRVHQERSDEMKKNNKTFFTRWLSTRKRSSINQNCDDSRQYAESKYQGGYERNHLPHQLLALPEINTQALPKEKLVRRQIFESIIRSENSYTSSLFRLIHEYKIPLEKANPPILSQNKIRVIFKQLEGILQFHGLFCINLKHHIDEWDKNEMIGELFRKEFTKNIVFDNYSGFINNFTNATETAKRASKSKAFAKFLHDKCISSPDRLSFFASMVKPVQRIPQLIVSISDLLKHTPYNHPDRMPLQEALTELETLADGLNEKKRDAERHFAVKQLLKYHLNESNTCAERYLIRQDDICLIDMDANTNTISKTKTRQIYLLNDMLICVSMPSNRLKFAVSLCDLTVSESVGPTMNNLSTSQSMKNVNDLANAQNYSIEKMEYDHQGLIHDLEIMKSISELVASLRFQYNGFNPNIPESICMGIIEEIRKKEFLMTLIDRSCLQLRIHSKNQKTTTLIVQFPNPELKRSWLVDMRLAKLALDRANIPGWLVNDDPHQPASLCIIKQRLPLFVRSFAIFKSEQSSRLTCALHYYLRQSPYMGDNPTGVLWICNVNVSASSLGALTTNGAEVSLIHSYELSESHVTCLESVMSTIWIGLRQGRIIVIDANSPGEWRQFASLDVQKEVRCLKYSGNFVYVGLINGVVAVFDAVNYDKPYLIQLSQSPVTCLLPINDEIFACSYNKIWRIKDSAVVDTLTMRTDQNIIPIEEEPNLLAHCGNGIWVSFIDSAILRLFHVETLKHVRDIDIGSKITMALKDINKEIKIVVTSMMATRGLLWIGTNVGMVATLSLPRLTGAPLVSESINVALHKFLAPVNILINLTAGSECIPQSPYNSKLTESKSSKNDEVEAIYVQYADLMNVADYINSGKRSEVDKMSRELSTVNLNVSEDSASTSSSGAIYQEGSRGMKPIQHKAITTNLMSNNNILYQENPQLEQMKTQHQNLPNNQFIESDPSLVDYGSQQSNKIYDQTLNQSMTRNQQTTINKNTSSHVSGITGQNAHANQSKVYVPSSKASQCQKTVLVLAGGNGYQRMALRDNEQYGEHAHCIIWEYKA